MLHNRALYQREREREKMMNTIVCVSVPEYLQEKNPRDE